MLEQGPVAHSAVNVVRQWDDHQLHVPDPADVLPWELGLEKLGAGSLYWHVSQGTDLAAHVRPVFAVVCDGVLCSTSSATAHKTALLAHEPRCAMATSTDGMDLVYDGVATPVHDIERLHRIAEAYHRKYGWPVVVTADGAFDAPFAAPAAGPPPYLVFVIEPVTVRGFGTDERFAARSTRWDFDR
jgi:hypothetical protein